MFERFSDNARHAVVFAQEEARALQHTYIGSEHVLLGLVREEHGAGGAVLRSIGLTLDNTRDAVEAIAGRGSLPVSGHIPFTPRAKKALEMSLRESLDLGHGHIGTAHLLLGLLRVNEGASAQALARLGVDPARARDRAIDAAKTSVETVPPAATVPLPQTTLDRANARARVIADQLRAAIAAKDAAIDAGDLAGAVAAREQEKALVTERAQLLGSLRTAGQPAPAQQVPREPDAGPAPRQRPE